MTAPHVVLILTFASGATVVAKLNPGESVGQCAHALQRRYGVERCDVASIVVCSSQSEINVEHYSDHEGDLPPHWN